MNADDVRAIVYEKARSGVQYVIIVICFLITVIDGFDILSISFVAPITARQWGLSDIELGFVFSAGLAGMTLGALTLSPVGDLFGRRTAIKALLAVIGAGMLLSATAENGWMLAAYRFMTGLGIGGIASNVGTTLLEFVSPERRAAALSFVFIGTPIGALISGSITLLVIERAGWEAVFLVGGVLTLLMIPVVQLGLPESVEFLLARRPRNALARLNAVLRRLEIPALDRMPRPGATKLDRTFRLTDVFRGDLLKRTISIGLIHLFYMYAFYAFVNWAAQLIVASGVSDSLGVSIAMLINVGGLAGALLAGQVATKLGLTVTTAVGFVGMACGLILFGAVTEDLWVLSAVCILTGVMFFGTQVSLYTYVVSSYPASVRATGIGLAFTIGRIGSIVGPYLAGVLLEFGAGRLVLMVLLALPQLIAATMIARSPAQYDAAPARSEA